MVSQYKDGLTKSKSALSDGLNTSFYSLIPLGRGVASEKTLLAVVDETLKTCNTLDKKGLQSLN
jgi:galactokinase